MSALRMTLFLLLAAITTSPAAAEEVYKCHIGKPSYCFKYGGNLCEKWNNVPNAKAACEKWTAACLDCHATIPECLGHIRPPSSSPQCTRCNKRWLACMNRIDNRYWPNRQQDHSAQ